jgi:hypothetical protein
MNIIKRLIGKLSKDEQPTKNTYPWLDQGIGQDETGKTLLGEWRPPPSWSGLDANWDTPGGTCMTSSTTSYVFNRAVRMDFDFGEKTAKDWRCDHCGQMNTYAEHLECRSCGAPRTDRG